jgi:hypothetical protein
VVAVAQNEKPLQKQQPKKKATAFAVAFIINQLGAQEGTRTPTMLLAST